MPAKHHSCVSRSSGAQDHVVRSNGSRWLTRTTTATLALLLITPISGHALQQTRHSPMETGSRTAAARLAEGPVLPPFMRGMHAPAPTPDLPGSRFVIEVTSRAVLRSLWEESTEEQQERVACITGYREGQIFHITKASPVRTEKADSLRVSIGPSLNRCGPPEWMGTVHTHIALFRGRPYSTLSPSDRVVMGLWRRKWGREGVFCVLYSETEAYCEYGTSLNGDTTYDVSRERR